MKTLPLLVIPLSLCFCLCKSNSQKHKGSHDILPSTIGKKDHFDSLSFFSESVDTSVRNIDKKRLITTLTEYSAFKKLSKRTFKFTAINGSIIKGITDTIFKGEEFEIKRQYDVLLLDNGLKVVLFSFIPTSKTQLHTIKKVLPERLDELLVCHSVEEFKTKGQFLYTWIKLEDSIFFVGHKITKIDKAIGFNFKGEKYVSLFEPPASFVGYSDRFEEIDLFDITYPKGIRHYSFEDEFMADQFQFNDFNDDGNLDFASCEGDSIRCFSMIHNKFIPFEGGKYKVKMHWSKNNYDIQIGEGRWFFPIR